jgi:hypothetical protein
MPVGDMLESEPFRFLDLPKELRFMVYENLTISTKQIRLLPLEDGLHVDQQETISVPGQPAITVTMQTLPIQIFTTCRTIYSEAYPFLTLKLSKIRSSIPKISVDSSCLYTPALPHTSALLCSILDSLDQHPLFSPGLEALSTHPNNAAPRPQYPRKIQHWLAQTTHLLLSQRPPACPFVGFMGARTYPTVRLIVQVNEVWGYTSYRGLAVGSATHVGAPPIYATSISTQLTELWSNLAGYTKGLQHVKSGAIVFGQEDERVLVEEGLVVRKTVALDFGLCRAC